MEITILGSGGCMRIPRPLCRCPVCRQARELGGPYRRTGPSAFIHDLHLLIDTPAEIALQLDNSGIYRIDHLMLTHLDPDHVEGLRVVEQICLDFRTWRSCKGRCIRMIVPRAIYDRLRDIRSVYGPLIDFYEDRGFLEPLIFKSKIRIGEFIITAVPVERGRHPVFIYVFENGSRKMIYAPCDIKPFPEQREEVRDADLLVIQPGMFEDGLKDNFKYPEDHISRTTLYTFEETMQLAKRIRAGRILFVHMEEYWNRGYDDYAALEKRLDNVRFATDGMRVGVQANR